MAGWGDVGVGWGPGAAALAGPETRPLGSPVPRRVSYALVGALLSIGAPLGLLLLRFLHSGLVSLSWVREEVAREPSTYLYLTVSTLLVFTVFGHALGRQADRLMDLSSRDPLTGLLNARVFHERLEEELERAARYGGPLSLLLIDMDGLKQINDRHGHRIGTQALLRVGAALRQTARATDLASRWGGDEFAVLAPYTSDEAARRLAERIRSATADSAGGTGVPFTISVGVATLDVAGGGAGTVGTLWESADAALYEAKRQGRNRVASAKS